MEKNKILVDGSNIAFNRRSKQKKPKIENLQILLRFLRKFEQEFHVEFLIIVDASLRYQIDDKSLLEEWEKVGEITQCPKNHQSDDFLIEYGQKHPDNSIIISNDTFREYDTEGLTICNFLVMFNEIIIIPNLAQVIQPARSIKIKGGQNVCKV